MDKNEPIESININPNQELSPFAKLLNALKAKVFALSGLDETNVSFEIATFEDLAPVVRVHHRKATPEGLDWMAIIPITTVWKSNDGRVKVELADRASVMRRYVRQWNDMEGLELLSDSMMDVGVAKWAVAMSEPTVEKVVEVAVENMVKDIVDTGDKEFVESLEETAKDNAEFEAGRRTDANLPDE